MDNQQQKGNNKIVRLTHQQNWASTYQNKKHKHDVARNLHASICAQLTA
jgi:hypothetical protein